MINTEFAKDFFQIIRSIIVQGKNEGIIRSDLSEEFCSSYTNSCITGIMLYGATLEKDSDFQSFATNSLKLICETLRTTETNVHIDISGN